MTVKVSKPLGWSGTTKDRQGSSGGNWGDNGAGRPTTEEYKEGYDKVDFSKGKPEKRGFRMKINGVYVDD